MREEITDTSSKGKRYLPPGAMGTNPGSLSVLTDHTLIPISESINTNVRVVSLEEHLSNEPESLPTINIYSCVSDPSGQKELIIQEHKYLNLDEENLKYVDNQIELFLTKHSEFLNIEPNIQNLLSLATKIMWWGTSDHDYDKKLTIAQTTNELLNISQPVITKCSYFNQGAAVVFRQLCKKYNQERLLSKYRLVETLALFSKDLQRDSDGRIKHSFLSLVSYSNGSFKVSAIDPYHTADGSRGRVANLNLIFQNLDKTNDRQLDVIAGFYNSITGDDKNYHLITYLTNYILRNNLQLRIDNVIAIISLINNTIYSIKSIRSERSLFWYTQILKTTNRTATVEERINQKRNYLSLNAQLAMLQNWKAAIKMRYNIIDAPIES